MPPHRWATLHQSDKVCPHLPQRSCVGCVADVAQLVAHHLAKVRVAGSNPVVRSECRKVPPCYGEDRLVPRWSGREARQRPAKPSTRVQIPSPPRINAARPQEKARPRTCSAVRLAHLPDTEGVPSSNLGRCTKARKPLQHKGIRAFLLLGIRTENGPNLMPWGLRRGLQASASRGLARVKIAREPN